MSNKLLFALQLIVVYLCWISSNQYINFHFNPSIKMYYMQAPPRQSSSNRKIPEFIAVLANEIAKVCKWRYLHQKDRSSKLFYEKGNMSELTYEQAKKAETNQRNLEKAVRLYSKSAREGVKIDSCIKDFASVIHQMGYTTDAVSFLTNMRQYYIGDVPKYDRLIETLGRQIIPSGKHQCKSLLFELPHKEKPTKEFLSILFKAPQRIKKAKAFNHLAFSLQPDSEGRWMVLDFDSFSAAKKTLETFKSEEWFGIKKYWMRGNMVTCQATDGRQDFEKKLVVTRQMLDEAVRKCFVLEDKITWTKVDREIYENQCAMILIDDDAARETMFDDIDEENYQPK